MPVIGFLNSGPQPTVRAGSDRSSAKAARKHGYVEGQNVAIEYRRAHGLNERLASAGGGA